MELLRIRPEHRYGVFEMGMNRPGEIRLLAELLEPQMVLVTNIGTAHIGMIGSREGIAREKAEAFSLFTGSETAVIPESGPCSELLAASVRGRVIRHGLGAAGVIAVRLSGIDGSVLDLGEGAVRLAPPGQAMADCAVAAITVARLIGVPFAVIRDGLEACPASFGRSEVIRGVVTVIQDCYNANPESTGAALQTIQGVRHEGRRIAVLGAMKELGAETDAAHRAVADIGLHSGLDEVWFVGDEYASAVAGRVSGPGTTARYFATDEWERVVQAASRVEPGALVLLKGSRAIALERLTPVLLRHEVDG